MMRCGIGQHPLKFFSVIVAPGHCPIGIDMDDCVAMLFCILLRCGNLPLDRLLGLTVGRIPRVNDGDFIN